MLRWRTAGRLPGRGGLAGHDGSGGEAQGTMGPGPGLCRGVLPLDSAPTTSLWLFFLRLVNKLVSSTSRQAVFWLQAKENTHWVRIRLTDQAQESATGNVLSLARIHRGSLCVLPPRPEGPSDGFHCRMTLSIGAAGAGPRKDRRGSAGLPPTLSWDTSSSHTQRTVLQPWEKPRPPGASSREHASRLEAVLGWDHSGGPQWSQRKT